MRLAVACMIAASPHIVVSSPGELARNPNTPVIPDHLHVLALQVWGYVHMQSQIYHQPVVRICSTSIGWCPRPVSPVLQSVQNYAIGRRVNSIDLLRVHRFTRSVPTK